MELPVAPDFLSVPPPADVDSVLEMSEYYLPRLLSRPDFWKDRDEERCLVEFDLEHPERVPATYPAALVEELFFA